MADDAPPTIGYYHDLPDGWACHHEVAVTVEQKAHFLACQRYPCTACEALAEHVKQAPCEGDYVYQLPRDRAATD